MTLTAAPPSPTRPTPPAGRRTARLAGWLYLVTFATSVPTLLLYAPLEERDFAVGAGSTTSVLAGASLEVLLALSCVATAVVLLPVVRRHHEQAAMGYLASRVVEGGLILVGVASLLTVVGLREEAGADPDTVATLGQTLVAVHERCFLLGQSLMPAVSALCLGSVLFRSGLVPRIIPAIGLAGAPLLLASDAVILWGGYAPDSAVAALGALPVAAWELSLAVWLIVRGFSPSRRQVA